MRGPLWRCWEKLMRPLKWRVGVPLPDGNTLMLGWIEPYQTVPVLVEFLQRRIALKGLPWPSPKWPPSWRLLLK